MRTLYIACLLTLSSAGTLLATNANAASLTARTSDLIATASFDTPQPQKGSKYPPIIAGGVLAKPALEPFTLQTASPYSPVATASLATGSNFDTPQPQKGSKYPPTIAGLY